MRTHRAPSKFLYPFLRFLLLILIPSAVSVAQYSLQDAFPALSAFSLPVELVPANDGSGRFFAVEQRGRIQVFAGVAGVSAKKLFLNISDSASQSGSEMGLLGLAFHPSYPSNGYFYVNYTDSVGGKLWSKISRFQVSATNPDSAVRSSELVLFILEQPYTNHNGGKILFGTDGYLYIAFGDGGSGGDPFNNAQNRGVLLGKILRIDVNGTSGPVNYAIPPSNPYAGNSSGYREEIFAYGLCNPWKMSFDATGRLWAADVGQNVWEEVDQILPGRNYGWRIMEGLTCYNPSTACDTTGLTLPVWVYSHPQPQGGSVTGGYVYRKNVIPSLTGKYVYADYIDGRIWALTVDGPNAGTNELLLDSPYNVSTFAEDTSGHLYVVSYGTGRIFRLMGPATSVQESREQPATFALEQNYPNPFNSQTVVTFSTLDRERIELQIFDLLGRLVRIIPNEQNKLGPGRIAWDGRDASNNVLPTGIYICRLISAHGSAAKRLLILR